MNKKYIVYQTVNTVNKKIYIGIHGTYNPEIFDGYIGCGVNINKPSTYMNPHTPFQCAVKKYGGKVFLRTILYTYDNIDDARKKEAQLVTKEFILNSNNYNVALGGGGFPTYYLPIYQFDDDGTLIKKWNTGEEAMEFFNGSVLALETALQFKEKLYGYFWSRKNSINREEYSHGDSKKLTYKYSKEGKCLIIYSSISEAAKFENIDRTTLNTAIRLQSLVKGQYYFSNSLYETFIPKPKISLRGKTFYLYKISGELIQKFIKAKDLMNYLNTKSYNTIYRAIFAQEGKYKEYFISLEDLGKSIPPITNLKSRAKKVLVYNTLGELLEECPSVQQAAKKYNASLSSVNRVLRGLAHTANGYVFKFVQ